MNALSPLGHFCVGDYPKVRVLDNICSDLLVLQPSGPVWYKEKLFSLPTNLDRVNMVYRDLKRHGLFPKVSPDLKNDCEAVYCRMHGNEAFKSKLYMKSLHWYTVSIMFAKTEEVRALAYGNRSNCMLKLGKYQECITDIDRAFSSRYSGKKTAVLVARRTEAERLLEPVQAYHEEVPEIATRNATIQSASSSVQIAQNEEFGRHVVATRTIQIGEVVSVEEPFASVLRRDHLVHCHECLTLCYNLIPCPRCTKAGYCSEACMEKAWNTYHRHECAVLKMMVDLQMVFLQLPFKVAIQAKPDYPHLDALRVDKGDVYRSDRYKEVHNLMTVPKTGFHSDLFKFAVGAAILFNLLEGSELLDSKEAEDWFKEVLLLQIQVVAMNDINIFEYFPIMPCYNRSEFAGALYAFSSLYNHSCCRNLLRSYHGTTLVVRAVNTIQAGEQCFIDYGDHYDVTSLYLRRISLSRHFGFLCKCRACEEDWESHFVCFGEAMGVPKNSAKNRVLQKKMAVPDVKYVKKLMPRVVARLKECERREPWGEVLTLKRMLGHCYDTLGNKRHL